MTLRIIGQVCPFNVANSFAETFEPGAVDQFIAEQTKPLPMRLMHEQQIGEWQKLSVAGGWLHSLGTMDDKDVEYAVRHRKYEELSISYADRDSWEKHQAFKARGVKPSEAEFIDNLKHTRFGRGVEAVAKFLASLPPEQACRKLLELHEIPDAEREEFMKEASRMVPQRVPSIIPQEISVVDCGSFGGTSFYWEAI